MQKTIFLFLLLTLLGGCVSVQPPSQENAPFEKVKSLKQFDGTYINLGIPSDETKVYLSRLIWPKKKLDHSSIISIKVKSIDRKTLVVIANGKERVIKEHRFIYGEDFKIKGGKIVLKGEKRVAGFEGGDPMVGIIYEDRELGLDQEGHGKYTSSGSVAGAIYMVLPIAMHIDHTVRFRRID